MTRSRQEEESRAVPADPPVLMPGKISPKRGSRSWLNKLSAFSRGLLCSGPAALTGWTGTWGGTRCQLLSPQHREQLRGPGCSQHPDNAFWDSGMLSYIPGKSPRPGRIGLGPARSGCRPVSMARGGSGCAFRFLPTQNYSVIL